MQLINESPIQKGDLTTQTKDHHVPEANKLVWIPSAVKVPNFISNPLKTMDEQEIKQPQETKKNNNNSKLKRDTEENGNKETAPAKRDRSDTEEDNIEEEEREENASKVIKRKRRSGGKHQMAACAACKLKRKKCDGLYPVCSGCTKRGTECTIVDATTGREIPRNYIETLEKNIKKLQDQTDRFSNLEEKYNKLLKKVSFYQNNSQSIDHKENKDNSKEGVVHQGFHKQEPLENTHPTSISYAKGNEIPIAEKPKDLASDIGFLTLTATSESGFLGPSSACSIAKAISLAIGGRSGFSGATTTSTVNESDIKETMEMPFKKPTVKSGRIYLTAYKNFVHLQYPFLNWDSIISKFEDVILRDSKDQESLFFIYMIFAIGCLLLEDSTPHTSSIYTLTFYNKAFENIGQIIEASNLTTVQAYLLIAVFSQKIPDGPSIWQTTGLAIRIAVALGLHREPYKSKRRQPSEAMKALEDLKSRVFWSAYGMERINGLVLGRPFSIADIDIDAPYPGETEENAVAIHVIRLRRIQSNICTFVYKPHKFTDDVEEIDATRVQILLELKDWMSTFPAKVNPTSTYDTNNWSIVSYHNCVLLLLRPVVLAIAKLKEKSSMRLLEWFKVFTQSASSICLNYKLLHSKGKLSYTWMTIHCCFVSGMSFLYCLWLDKSLKLLQWRSKSHIYDTISACSMILYVLAEKWPRAKVFRDTFDKMSKTVLNSENGNGEIQESKKVFTDILTHGLFEGNFGIDQYLGHKYQLNVNSVYNSLDEENFSAERSNSQTNNNYMNGNDTSMEIYDNIMNQQNDPLLDFLNTSGDPLLKDIFYEIEDNYSF
ncbi:binding protein [[Candida] boidinii]|nr:binding protein [[Candida] boidinii]